MPVSSWSTTAASNTGILTGITLDGSSMNVPLVDDALRELCAQVAAQLGKVGFKGADVASAATTDLSTATGWYVDVTGTTTITSLGTVAAGQVFILRFASSLLLTHNASTLILPNGNIYTTGGDVGIFVSLGAGAWRMLNYIGSGGSSIPAGSIIDFAGTAAPTGWLMCYGQTVSRSTYAALFAAIGTAYGVGDGSTTFNVPDLRGRVTAGKDDMGGSSAARLNTIASTTLGTGGGAQTHTLTTAQLPSHAHTASCGGENTDHSHYISGNTGTVSEWHTHTYTRYGSLWSGVNQSGGSGNNFWKDAVGATTDNPSANHVHGIGFQSGGRNVGHIHAITVDAAGSGSAHNNIQPTLIMQKIIKV